MRQPGETSFGGMWKILQLLIGVRSISHFLQEKLILAIAARQMRVITMIKLFKSFKAKRKSDSHKNGLLNI